MKEGRAIDMGGILVTPGAKRQWHWRHRFRNYNAPSGDGSVSTA
jgi:hypothetical protein